MLWSIVSKAVLRSSSTSRELALLSMVRRRSLPLWLQRFQWRPPLAPCSSSHQIQDDGTDLQGCQRKLPDPPPSARPHAPARALRSTTSASRLVPPSLRASKGGTAKSQLFSVLALWWNELLTWRPQSRSPASARDSRPTCSEFTWTLYTRIRRAFCVGCHLVATPLLSCYWYVNKPPW